MEALLEAGDMDNADETTETVIVVVKCSDGVVLAADSKQKIGDTGESREVEKLQCLNKAVGTVWYTTTGHGHLRLLLDQLKAKEPDVAGSANPMDVMGAVQAKCQNLGCWKGTFNRKTVVCYLIIAGDATVFCFRLHQGQFTALDGAVADLMVARDEDGGIVFEGSGKDAAEDVLMPLFQNEGIGAAPAGRTMAAVAPLVRQALATIIRANSSSYDSPVDVVEIGRNSATLRRYNDTVGNPPVGEMWTRIERQFSCSKVSAPS